MTKPPVQATERRHFDPKGTWIISILASGAIHGFAFWLLYPFLEGHLENVYSQNEPIPIDLIVLEPEKPSPTPAKPNSVNKQPTPQPPEKIAKLTPKPTVKNSPNPSPGTTAPQPEIKPSPSSPQQPKIKPSPTRNTPQPEIKPSPSPQNKPPASPAPQPPTLIKESPSPSPPTPSPPSEEKSPSSSQPGGRYGVSIRRELKIAGSLNDDPSQLAKPQTQQQSFNFADYDLPLTTNADQPIILRVILLIDQTGKPALEDSQLVEGGINIEVARLAEVIVNQWRFEPTLNKQGEAFAQTYEVFFTVSLISS